MKINYKKEINRASLSFLGSILAMDLQTLGDNATWFGFDPLFAKSWTSRILKMISDLKGTSYLKIAKMFPNASELRVKMWFDIWSSHYGKISKPQRFQIAKFYVNLLKTLCLSDPYAFSKNIIHSPKEVAKLCANLKPANPLIAKKIGRFISACYHLGHALYSDMYPSIVYENYGPYFLKKFGKNRLVAIKTFDNLSCPELWPETKNFAWQKIELVCVYKNVQMTVDSASHAVFTGDLINGLEYYRLTISGKKASLETISQNIEKLAIKIFKKTLKFSWEEKKIKYCRQKAYVYKNMYDFLKQDWRPSRQILTELKNKPVYKVNWPKNRQKLKKFILKMLRT